MKAKILRVVLVLCLIVITVSACRSSAPSYDIYTPVIEENDLYEAQDRENAGVFSAQDQGHDDEVHDNNNDIMLQDEIISSSLTTTDTPYGTYILPTPTTTGTITVEEAIASRRSRRRFYDRQLTAQQLSQILWAAYGITSPYGLRTAPSAGAIYPLEIYVAIGNVDGLAPGIYRYIVYDHTLERVVSGDVRSALADAAVGQRSVNDAPITILYSANFDSMLPRYGERGVMYTHIEVGHSAQNVYLQAEALGLGTVAVGAFIDELVSELFLLPYGVTPLYLMPVGYFY